MTPKLLSLIILVLTFRPTFSQSDFSSVILLRFGDPGNVLTLGESGVSPIKGATNEIPRDILITRDGMIHIPDAYGWRILSYTKDGALSAVTSLPRPLPRVEVAHVHIFLAYDASNRLYVHVTELNRFRRLYVISEDRDGVVELPLVGRQPGRGDLVGKLYIGYTGSFYFPFDPIEIIRPGQEDFVFKYSASGEFTGMVDYYLDDSLGRLYTSTKIEVGGECIWKLTRFPPPDSPGETTRHMTMSDEIALPAGPAGVVSESSGLVHQWTCLGLDDGLRTYVTDGHVVKVFDASFHLEHEFVIPVEAIKAELGLEVSTQNLRVDSAGKVFAFGPIRVPGPLRESRKRTLGFAVVKLR